MKEKKEKKPGTHNKVLLEKRGEKKKYIEKRPLLLGFFMSENFFGFIFLSFLVVTHNL